VRVSVTTAPRRHLDRLLSGAAAAFYERLARGELATTSCCGTTGFPPRLRCPRCGGESRWVQLPRRGRLEAFTTQESALRFAAPAVLALARLGEAVLPGVADVPYETLEIGQPVQVELRPVEDLGLTLVWFVPVQAR
jgi:uncharacterized OB-fold protein